MLICIVTPPDMTWIILAACTDVLVHPNMFLVDKTELQWWHWRWCAFTTLPLSGLILRDEHTFPLRKTNNKLECSPSLVGGFNSSWSQNLKDSAFCNMFFCWSSYLKCSKDSEQKQLNFPIDVHTTILFFVFQVLRDKSSTKPKPLGRFFPHSLRAGDGIRSQASEKEEVDEDDEAAASFIWYNSPWVWRYWTPKSYPKDQTSAGEAQILFHCPINCSKFALFSFFGKGSYCWWKKSCTSW